MNTTELSSNTTNRKMDAVVISKVSKQYWNKIENLKTAVNKIPDVRHSKISEVKQKLETGFYDKEDVIKKVADTIITEMIAL